MGTPQFAVPILLALLEHQYPVAGVVTQPDRPVGRKRMLTPPPIKVAALAHGLAVFQPERIRRSESFEVIAKWQPEMIVTVAYGQILPPDLLASVPLQALNVHASLLPKYRGAAPIQWALMNGEKETGITLMTMVKELDAGPMWASVAVPMHPDMTYGELHDELSHQGATLLINTLPRILRGELIAQPQDEASATYAPMLARADEQVDFAQSSYEVYNHIRAFSPAPGVFTYLNDKLFKIMRAQALHDWRGSAYPGEIVGADQEGLLIACQQGAIRALEVQLEGKKVQPAGEFVRGLRSIAGLRCFKR